MDTRDGNREARPFPVAPWTVDALELVGSSAPGRLDAAFKAYQDHGFFILLNAFSPAWCNRLVTAAQRLPSALDGSFAPQMMPHRELPEFAEAQCNESIVLVMEALLGGPVSALQSQYFFGRPGGRGFAIHQDNFFVEARPETFASAWSALTDVTPEMGSLRVYPGAHREGILPVRETGAVPDRSQPENAVRLTAVVPETYTPFDTTVPEGAVVILHGYLPHGSGTNQTSRWRHSLLNTYLRSGAPFRPGQHARREERPTRPGAS